MYTMILYPHKDNYNNYYNIIIIDQLKIIIMVTKIKVNINIDCMHDMNNIVHTCSVFLVCMFV